MPGLGVGEGVAVATAGVKVGRGVIVGSALVLGTGVVDKTGDEGVMIGNTLVSTKPDTAAVFSISFAQAVNASATNNTENSLCLLTKFISIIAISCFMCFYQWWQEQ